LKVSVETDGGIVELVSGSTKRFYLICVDGIGGSWVNPSNFYQGAISVLSSASDAAVTRISTLNDLDSLVRNPPEGAVLINCHGELIPRPTTWPNWQSYYDALSGATVEKGWIFVTADGYPLYYTQLESIGSAGLNRFLSRIGASADAWGRTSHSPSGGRDLAAAVPMGGGYYLNVETSQLSDYDGGRYAAAFSYWLADKAQLKPGQARGFTLTGLQVTVGQRYALTVTVNWLDGSSASKILTIPKASSFRAGMVW